MKSVLTLDRVADLSDVDCEAVSSLTLVVYPPARIANWPGRDVEWDSPEWCVRIRDETDTLSCYVGVYVREAEWQGRSVRIGGIGNVKTHPAVRGRGFAALAIRRAIEFFRIQGVEFGLLVCQPHLVGYYARLGWHEFAGRLIVRQHGQLAEFTLSGAMTHEVRSEAPLSGNIDLRGPPW